MSKKWRVAIVVQRYGEEVAGGAELHARWLAEHLLPLADVHVITTCAVDYTTWADFYPPGDAELNGVIIHRFPVDAPRNWQRAKKQAGRFLFREHTLFDEFVWMKEQGPYSTPFFNHLQASYPHFDAFIFFTFLYATTFLACRWWRIRRFWSPPRMMILICRCRFFVRFFTCPTPSFTTRFRRKIW